MSKGETRVVHPSEIIGLVLGDHPLQKIGDPPAGRCILALAGGQRSGNQRKESAINERVAIDQEESRAVWTFHEVNIKRARSDRDTRAFERRRMVLGQLSVLSLTTRTQREELRLTGPGQSPLSGLRFPISGFQSPASSVSGFPSRRVLDHLPIRQSHPKRLALLKP